MYRETPLRIGHIIQSGSLGVGGPVTAMIAMCSALVRAGCECSVACHGGDLRTAPGLDGRIAVSEVGIGRNPLGNGDGMKNLSNFIRNVDVLHLHGLWDPLPGAAARLARKLRTPYVVSLHGMLLERSMANHQLRKRLFLAFSGETIMGRASALHFTTRLEQRESQPFLPEGLDRVVIPLTIDGGLLERLPGRQEWRRYFPQLPETWPRLLFLSRIHPVKNLPSLIRALPGLVKEFRGLHLVVAGDGEAEYVQKMHRIALDAGVSKEILFIGSVTGEEKAALISSATVMTIPSFHENFGMAVAEGLACEVPTLVTPGLGIGAEILAHGAGVPCGEDSESISTAIAGALRKPEDLRIAGENGRRWAIETLAPGAVAAQLLRLYVKASGGGST